MNKSRVLVALASLILITLCIVLGPSVINSCIKKDLVESKDFWKYEEAESYEISSKTFAQMYVDHIFDNETGYSNVYNDADVLNQETIKTQLRTVLQDVFGKNGTAFDKFEIMLNEYDLESYEREVLLTVVDNRAISFVFVYIQFSNGMDNIQIAYEEKTSTLIGFLYEMWTPEKADWNFINAARTCFPDYYLNTLELIPGQYIIVCSEKDGKIGLASSIGYYRKEIMELEEKEYIYEDGVFYY